MSVHRKMDNKDREPEDSIAAGPHGREVKNELAKPDETTRN
jgi:hypothetical protein